MSIDTATLAQYAGKDVRLKTSADDDYVEGHVEKASEVGLAFKPKGKRELTPVWPQDIEDIQVIEKAAPKLKQKKQLPLEDSRVKNHLVNVHGYYLSAVNAMTVEGAVKEHDSIDHKDLGHNHDKVEGDNSDSPEQAPEGE